MGGLIFGGRRASVEGSESSDGWILSAIDDLEREMEGGFEWGIGGKKARDLKERKTRRPGFWYRVGCIYINIYIYSC